MNASGVETSIFERRWPRRLLWTLLALIVLGIVLLSSPRDELGWIDPVTRSMKKETRWFGITTSTVIEQSAIEKWIIRREGHYTNHWKCEHDTSTTAYGLPTCFSCGTMPEIFGLYSIERFVRNASDQEIDAFVQVMKTGTKAEKKKATKAAEKKTSGDG